MLNTYKKNLCYLTYSLKRKSLGCTFILFSQWKIDVEKVIKFPYNGNQIEFSAIMIVIFLRSAVFSFIKQLILWRFLLYIFFSAVILPIILYIKVCAYLIRTKVTSWFHSFFVLQSNITAFSCCFLVIFYTNSDKIRLSRVLFFIFMFLNNIQYD